MASKAADLRYKYGRGRARAGQKVSIFLGFSLVRALSFRAVTGIAPLKSI
jgi:hypothetical protein